MPRGNYLVLKYEEKENLDPQVIPVQKKKKLGKKEHNLTKNVLNNRPN